MPNWSPASRSTLLRPVRRTTGSTSPAARTGRAAHRDATWAPPRRSGLACVRCDRRSIAAGAEPVEQRRSRSRRWSGRIWTRATRERQHRRRIQLRSAAGVRGCRPRGRRSERTVEFASGAAVARSSSRFEGRAAYRCTPSRLAVYDIAGTAACTSTSAGIPTIPDPLADAAFTLHRLRAGHVAPNRSIDAVPAHGVDRAPVAKFHWIQSTANRRSGPVAQALCVRAIREPLLRMPLRIVTLAGRTRTPSRPSATSHDLAGPRAVRYSRLRTMARCVSPMASSFSGDAAEHRVPGDVHQRSAGRS